MQIFNQIHMQNEIFQWWELITFLFYVTFNKYYSILQSNEFHEIIYLILVS